MGIQVDWQIVKEDAPLAASTAPSEKMQLHSRRRWQLVGGATLAVLVTAAVAAGVFASMVRSRTRQAAEQVQAVARLEAQAIAADDLSLFMALQDPDDDDWRALQRRRFARLERQGFPEFGWKVMGVAPQPGQVSLEPGGARLDVQVRFSIAQPMPTGPLSVTLGVPQYYKQTPEGWVRARPGPDYWGKWRKQAGKTTVAIYAQRDADVIEPLALRLDEIMQRLCDTLPCPVRLPITFETDAESLSRLGSFSYGYDLFGLKLPSPQWIGLPADAASRDELYRAYGTRLVQSLVYEASGKKLDMTTFASREFVRWQLAKAGLTEPFIGQSITQTLSASPGSLRQPLALIALRSAPVRLELRPGQIAVPFAFDFLERQLGPGTLNRLLPALAAPQVRTMGEAITLALRLNPATLEPAWQSYVREWESLLASEPGLPDGELALWCAQDTDARTGSAIVRLRVNGGEAQFLDNGAWVSNAWPPHWSPDGAALAYAQGDQVSARVIVMDADRRTFRVVAEGLAGAPGVEWLPAAPKRLQIVGATTRVVNLDTGESVELAGTRHAWSPDGKRVAFQWPYPDPMVWIADADGRAARELARGDKLAWSPDGKRLAFLGLPSRLERFYERQVQIAEAATSSVITLTCNDDLVGLLTGHTDETSSLTDLAWSPDGAMLAVGVSWPASSAVVVLDASSGAVRAQWQWNWKKVSFPVKAWSADLRHLAVWLAPDSSGEGAPGLLDVQTGAQTDLIGAAFDWSPDGQWLALAQQPSGLLLVRTDLSVTRWLDAPACFDVAWRPEPGE